MLLKAEYRHRHMKFLHCRMILSDILKKINDFSMDLVLSCESSIIPFIQSFVEPQAYSVSRNINIVT